MPMLFISILTKNQCLTIYQKYCILFTKLFWIEMIEYLLHTSTFFDAISYTT